MLFVGDKKDASNAHVGWKHDRHSFYAMGYSIAARELSDSYSRRPVQERDALVFPIIFLYRQHIELTLKNIVREFVKQLPIDRKYSDLRNEKILVQHKLRPLWDRMKCIVDTVYRLKSSSFVFKPRDSRHIEKFIYEFDDIDQLSFNFRYPTDKSGHKVLTDVKVISVDNFRSEAEKIITYLDDMREIVSHF